MPVPTEEELSHVNNVTSTEAVVSREEEDYDVDEVANMVKATVPMFTEQGLIYQRVPFALMEGQQLVALIDAQGGCGRCFSPMPS